MIALRVSPPAAPSRAPALGIAVVAVLVGACSNPQLIETPKAAAEAPAAAAPQEPDAYRDHVGPHIAAGTTFRLKDTAYAVDGVGVVVSLVKAAWSKRTLDDGRVIREGSAEIAVARGESTQRKIMEQGDVATVAGAKITVINAGEDYDERRLDYIPWVELKVEPAP